MMKNWMKIIILVVVLGILTTAFILLSKNKDAQGDDVSSSPEPGGTDPTADSVVLIEFDRESINKIILKRGDGEIVLDKEERDVESLETDDEGKTKKVTEKKMVWVNPDFDVDNYKVDSIVTAASALKSTRFIDENPGDLTMFGLDNATSATFVTSDGKEYSIEIGNQTPTSDGYYARKKGSPQVYTVGSYDGERLKYGKFDIMEKNLYGSDAIAIEDIKALKFSRSGEMVFNSAKGANTEEWLITEPLEREANTSEIYKFLDWLYNFRVSEFVEENVQDLKPYGLDNPKYIFEYNLGGKDYVLKLGSLKDSKYYGMINDSPTVFSVDSSSLDFIDLPLISIISRFIYIPSIYDVEKLVIEIDGRTDILLINDSQDGESEPDFRINGRRMENDDQVKLFRKYYQGAVSIMGDKLDLNAEPEGDWFARLTYTRKKADPDKVVTVELIPTGDGYGYYLMKNGTYSGMVMGKRKLDEYDGIRQAYRNLMEGLE